MSHWTNANLMLDHRLGRWPNISPQNYTSENDRTHYFIIAKTYQREKFSWNVVISSSPYSSFNEANRFFPIQL